MGVGWVVVVGLDAWGKDKGKVSTEFAVGDSRGVLAPISGWITPTWASFDHRGVSL